MVEAKAIYISHTKTVLSKNRNTLNRMNNSMTYTLNKYAANNSVKNSTIPILLGNYFAEEHRQSEMFLTKSAACGTMVIG